MPKVKPPPAVPTSLRAALEARKLPQRRLAGLMGVTPAAVTYWCKGAASPGGPARRLMASILTVPLEVVESWFVTRL